MVRIIVDVALKKGVADPEGANIKKALDLLGYKGIAEVNTIKKYELIFDGDEEDAKNIAEEICERLLANPVIHTYAIEVKE
ncbi:MAG: phosphoribosylformylglycinamidine synthase subunit PurS [Candidatus Thermoplasmatota archaeon]